MPRRGAMTRVQEAKSPVAALLCVGDLRLARWKHVTYRCFIIHLNEFYAALGVVCGVRGFSAQELARPCCYNTHVNLKGALHLIFDTIVKYVHAP